MRPSIRVFIRDTVSINLYYFSFLKNCRTSSQVNVWFSGANFRRACIDKAVVHLVWKVKQKSCSFKCIREKEPICFCNCYEEQQNFQLLSSNFVLRDLISAKLRKVSSKEKLKLLLKLALFLPFFLHFLINLSFSFIFLLVKYVVLISRSMGTPYLNSFLGTIEINDFPTRIANESWSPLIVTSIGLRELVSMASWRKYHVCTRQIMKENKIMMLGKELESPSLYLVVSRSKHFL